MITRRRSGRLIAGVAGGIADRMRIDDLYVRAGFLVLALVWGLGGIVYLLLWVVTLDRIEDRSPSPGVDENRRNGYLLAFAGGLLALRALGVWSGDRLILSAGAVIFGTAFLMDRRDIDPRSAILALFDPNSGRFRTRAVLGILLLLPGLGIMSATVAPALDTVLLAVVATGMGMLVLFGPWVWRLVTDLGTERSKLIREQERAAMAAHLHDSVLQTLALIQRTDDPRRVIALARVQERELRRWLYGPEPTDGPELLSLALQKEVDRIESTFAIPVHLVTVGDQPVDDRIGAMVASAGEAMANAARHSGASRISLYCEVTEESADLWVSDLGHGFDLDSIPADRRGVTDSIIGRMASRGGKATVVSQPGSGTEVHLQMDRRTS